MLKSRFLVFLAILPAVLSPAVQGAAKEKRRPAEDTELARLKQLKNKLALENAIAAERLKKVLRELRFQHQKTVLENNLQEAKRQKKDRKVREQMARTQLELLNLKKMITALALETAKQNRLLSKLKTDLALRENRRRAAAIVRNDLIYSRYPFKNGVLTISDRRISLNGPIIRGVADMVTRRIHYFNNLGTEYPIFIVIDICPGGSVMEGYRILKAMQASRAPVYVVVKSFAASMAAVITTLAKRSFAYPNAVILHHQMSTVNWGNMTEIQEQLKTAKEWERRLHLPVARKMGVSVKDFVRQMYRHNSRGDWDEFADRALKLKWVDHVVSGIEEQSIIRKPGRKKPGRRYYEALVIKRDPHGARYVELPRLSPFDFYFIYNPDRFYR